MSWVFWIASRMSAQVLSRTRTAKLDHSTTKPNIKPTAVPILNHDARVICLLRYKHEKSEVQSSH